MGQWVFEWFKPRNAESSSKIHYDFVYFNEMEIYRKKVQRVHKHWETKSLSVSDHEIILQVITIDFYYKNVSIP